MYRLPYKGLSKQVSLLLVVAMAALLLLFIVQLFLQKKNEKDLRLKTVNGIIGSKRDLRRGSFGFVVKQNQRSEEYDMAGYDYFLTRFKLEIRYQSKKHLFL